MRRGGWLRRLAEMSAVQLNVEQFYRRITEVHGHWLVRRHLPPLPACVQNALWVGLPVAGSGSRCLALPSLLVCSAD